MNLVLHHVRLLTVDSDCIAALVTLTSSSRYLDPTTISGPRLSSAVPPIPSRSLSCMLRLPKLPLCGERHPPRATPCSDNLIHLLSPVLACIHSYSNLSGCSCQKLFNVGLSPGSSFFRPLQAPLPSISSLDCTSRLLAVGPCILQSHLQDPPPRLDGTLDPQEHRTCDTVLYSFLVGQCPLTHHPSHTWHLGRRCKPLAEKDLTYAWLMYIGSLACSHKGIPLFVHVFSFLPSFILSNFVISFTQFHCGYNIPHQKCAFGSPEGSRKQDLTGGSVHPSPVVLPFGRLHPLCLLSSLQTCVRSSDPNPSSACSFAFACTNLAPVRDSAEATTSFLMSPYVEKLDEFMWRWVSNSTGTSG